jgi:hypothetical protein
MNGGYAFLSDLPGCSEFTGSVSPMVPGSVTSVGSARTPLLSEASRYPVINETPNKPQNIPLHTTCTSIATCIRNATSVSRSVTNTSADCLATKTGVAGVAEVPQVDEAPQVAEAAKAAKPAKVGVGVGVAQENTFTQEIGLILVGVLAFIISFMWKDFITDMEHIILPSQPSMLARFLYTMTVTILVISLVIYLKRYLNLSGIPHFDDHPEDSGD